MLRWCRWLLFLLCTLQSRQLQADEPVRKLLFGSCIKQDQPMPILRTMRDEHADAVIFLGDNIYADTTDMVVMQQKYDALAANQDFHMLKTTTPFLATWDDHDYGVNDGGAEYALKNDAQRLFLDFWNVPVNSPRRHREGVYDSVIIGPPGQRVQLILLDTRYFRSPLRKGPERKVGGWYIPDDSPDKTMLGAEQWNWLEQELMKPADFRVIASSIQFAAANAGQETWANLPLQRTRLIELISKTKADGVFFISGDRHWSEFSCIEDNVPYPIWDFTSSSFNQIHPRGTPTENPYRAVPKTFHQENYGVIEFMWENEGPAVQVKILNTDGATEIEQRLTRSQLEID